MKAVKSTTCRDTAAELITLAESLVMTRDPDSGTDDTAPHFELIDFDRLRELLRESAAAFVELHKLEGETQAIREWFLSRISAMRRGDRALRRGDMEQSPPPPDSADLPELLRRYETAAARLRYSAPGTCLSNRKNDKAFHQYKS